jgi:large subunit ribosomal protein L21e
MTKNKGLRQGTRKKFARPFGKNGMPAPSTYIRSFKLGDPVDIVANGAIHKGATIHRVYLLFPSSTPPPT